MVSDLKPDDILSRYLFYKSDIDYNTSPHTVKTSVFKGKHPDGFSVYKTTNLLENYIWNISKEYVEPSYPDRPLLGRGDLAVKFYQLAKLNIVKKEPPPRHYNIFGMPVGSGLEEAEKLSLRQEMRANSKFIPVPL
ncbi:MAG: hypothetical protein AABY33_04255 [Pseudomonadota bacterium]